MGQNIIPIYTVDIHFQNAHKTHETAMARILFVYILSFNDQRENLTTEFQFSNELYIGKLTSKLTI